MVIVQFQDNKGREGWGEGRNVNSGKLVFLRQCIVKESNNYINFVFLYCGTQCQGQS